MFTCEVAFKINEKALKGNIDEEYRVKENEWNNV